MSVEMRMLYVVKDQDGIERSFDNKESAEEFNKDVEVRRGHQTLADSLMEDLYAKIYAYAKMHNLYNGFSDYAVDDAIVKLISKSFVKSIKFGKSNV